MKRTRITAAYVFVCPACGDRIEVDEALRQYTLREGCILCESPASPADFERNDV